MKKFLILIMFIGLPLYGQNKFVVDFYHGADSNYVDLNITNATKDTLYYVHPGRIGNFYFSEILPTDVLRRHTSHVFEITGDMVLHWKYTNVSGSGTNGFWIKPLTYDPVSDVFVSIEMDSSFLVFDTPETYQASSEDMVTPVDDRVYTCQITFALKAVAGFMLIEKQTGTHVSINHFWTTFTRKVY